MKRHTRKTISEINLTPLLDVLFSILFIILMTARQNEKGLVDEYLQQTAKMNQRITELNVQVKDYENQMASYDKYQAEAVIITVANHIKEENHYLVVKKDMSHNELENIQLGVEKTENTKTRIKEVITKMVEGTDSQPVYVVFYCDKNNIYTAEYKAIVDAFNWLQTTYKEVFVKVMEESK